MVTAIPINKSVDESFKRLRADTEKRSNEIQKEMSDWNCETCGILLPKNNCFFMIKDCLKPKIKGKKRDLSYIHFCEKHIIPSSEWDNMYNESEKNGVRMAPIGKVGFGATMSGTDFIKALKGEY